MSIATYSDYLAKLATPISREHVCRQSLATTAIGTLYSMWRVAPSAAAIPSTPEALTKASVGAIGQRNGSAATRLARVIASSGEDLSLFVIDRLSHQGGLSGTAVGQQTTNFPTTALTRYTTGRGVMAAAEIYSLIGTTARFASMDYTNSAGVAARTSPSFGLGGTGLREVGRFLIFNLAAGDEGVRSVESISMNASTGTVGNWGVTLFRIVSPLLTIPGGTPDRMVFDSFLHFSSLMPQILDDACLQLVVVPTASTTGNIAAQLGIIQD